MTLLIECIGLSSIPRSLIAGLIVPIIKTYILYGNKDNMQNEDIIKNFSNKFNCGLTILENGEHYFHTEEQLKFYKEWLEKF